MITPHIHALPVRLRSQSPVSGGNLHDVQSNLADKAQPASQQAHQTPVQDSGEAPTALPGKIGSATMVCNGYPQKTEVALFSPELSPPLYCGLTDERTVHSKVESDQ